MKTNFIWLLTSKILTSIIGIVTAGLINRALGPFDRGALAGIYTWATLFAVIFGFSLDSTIYHYANKDLYKDNEGSKFLTTLLLCCFYAAIGIIIFILMSKMLPNTVKITDISLLILTMLLIFSTMVTTNLFVFYQARNKFRIVAVIGIIQTLVYLVFIGTLYSADKLNLVAALIGYVLLQVIGLISIIFLALKDKLFGYFSKTLAIGMIFSGLKLHAATIITFIYTRFNQLILLHYWGNTEAGFFAVSLSLALAIVIVPGTFQTVLYPRVVHADDDYDITIRSLRLVFYGWGGVLLLFLVFSEPMLMIYGGREFVNGSLASFRILLLTAWFLPLASIVSPYLVKIGAFSLMSKFSIGVGIVSLILNYMLIPYKASLGAAWATSISCFLVFITSLIMLTVITKKNTLSFLRLRGGVS